MIAQEM